MFEMNSNVYLSVRRTWKYSEEKETMNLEQLGEQERCSLEFGLMVLRQGLMAGSPNLVTEYFLQSSLYPCAKEMSCHRLP